MDPFGTKLTAFEAKTDGPVAELDRVTEEACSMAGTIENSAISDKIVFISEWGMVKD